jgi:uncharacterized phage protein (TIGR02218 family)
MTARDQLLNHLGTKVTTVCRAWLVVRKDGQSYGFTDHDQDLTIDGQIYRASGGMSAKAFQQGTGFSVDNSEATGILSDASISDEDIAAGRFDKAEVRSWLLNWTDTSQRIEQFRGNFGDITRSAGAYTVELRGLTDRLNQPQGRVFHRGCSAVLGDDACKVDLNQINLYNEVNVLSVTSDEQLAVSLTPEFQTGWFDKGYFDVLSGHGIGLRGYISRDITHAERRVIYLSVPLGVTLEVGTRLRLVVGCDRKAQTCQSKFGNFLNFRGFPHMPGEDWLTSYPVSNKANDGGSLAI